MAEVLGLTQLKVGQRVKIKGNPGANGDFRALEVNVKPGEDPAVMEGKIQAVDPENRTIRIMNREIKLGENVEIKNIHRQPISFEDLQEGDLIKLKGGYSESEGFVPKKAKLQIFKGFDIEELQGYINRIDAHTGVLDVLGFQVVVDSDAEIEGF
ncbi:MAG: DUF5666 domain-containing protein [candidate division KSB1 bacterium]|nr:DUF5666 domain-containing protein [candidate division KSB1 bacterium]MDQ7065581.1 DUF5666 domain-containing protein [candidate division KSB1 bacterium]